MARVVVTPSAREDLERLVESHSLPHDTRRRLRHTLDPLSRFPLFGAALDGEWSGFRFILGPWRWMIVVYVFDEARDDVFIATIQDGRSVPSATSRR